MEAEDGSSDNLDNGEGGLLLQLDEVNVDLADSGLRLRAEEEEEDEEEEEEGEVVEVEVEVEVDEMGASTRINKLPLRRVLVAKSSVGEEIFFVARREGPAFEGDDVVEFKWDVDVLESLLLSV